MKVGIYVSEDVLAEGFYARLKKTDFEIVIGDESCLCEMDDIRDFDAVVCHPHYPEGLKDEDCLPKIGKLAQAHPDTHIYLLAFASSAERRKLTGEHENLTLLDGPLWGEFIRAPAEYIERTKN